MHANKDVRLFSGLVLLFFVLLVNATPAFADDAADSIVKIMCNAINLVNGTFGRSIAVIVVFSLALGLFFGKVSWGIAIATAVGLGVLFGAEGLVNTLSGATEGGSGAGQGLDCEQYRT